MGSSFDNEVETPEIDTIAKIAENLVFRLRGCDDTYLRKTIQTVYRDFCRRSCALETKQVVEVTEPTTEVPVYAKIPDASVEVVKEVRIDRRHLTEGIDYELLGDVIVFPCEINDVRLFISCAEVPNIGCESAPRDFLNRHADDIASGVLANLMSVTGRAWSDPDQAKAEMIKYENAVNTARLSYYRGSAKTNGAMRADGEGVLL